MRKRLITCIASLLLTPLAFAATDGVQKSEVVDGIKWLYTVEDEGAVIGESSERYKYYSILFPYYEPAIPHDTVGAITIPTTLGGFPVVAIGAGSFGDCSRLTNITIHEGIRRVHFYAFRGCSGLTSITIPTSVTTISDVAFSGCSGLTNITIPASVTEIGRWAFQGCSSLISIDVEEGNAVYASVDGVLFNKTLSQIVRYPEGKKGALTIPASMTTIVDWVFSDGLGLTSINVEEGNATYASVDGVLFDKTLRQIVKWPGGKMGTFTLPASVKAIDRRAFSDCLGLTSINVEKGNTAYASVDGVLFNKTLTQIVRCPGGKVGAFTIPASMTKIYHDAFDGCTSLTSITIAEGVKRIDFYAALRCPSLISITIPASLTKIDYDAINNCSSLTNIDVEEGNTAYASVDGVLFDKTLSRIVRCPEGKVGAFTIPEGVKTVYRGSFVGCSRLTSITIPASVTSIDPAAFWSCFALKRLIFEGNVPTLRSSADFSSIHSDFMIYYHKGATGWTNPWRKIKTQMLSDAPLRSH